MLLCGQRIISQMHLGYSKIILTDPARKQNCSHTLSVKQGARNCRHLLTDSHRSCRDEREARCRGSRAVLPAVSRGQEKLEKQSHRWCCDRWGHTKRPHSSEVQCRRLPSSQPHNCRVLAPSCLLLEQTQFSWFLKLQVGYS